MSTRIVGGGGRRSNRIDEASNTNSSAGGKRASNPPSRHLWVGNLAEGVTEEEVSFQFSRFGELESLAFQPGRSYTFINFKYHDDAIAAFSYLQGRSLAGNPLRIEFAKLDKAAVSASASEGDYIKHHDELRVSSRGSPLSHRDVRIRDEQFRLEKIKPGEKSGDPSEVLWIGFPALLKVDEFILAKAFSPFGDIEKITSFPGRSYAFVRFRTISSAIKAKETLQGKLFGNPRVHICFAKSETGAPVGRFPPSPPSKHRARTDYEYSDVYGVDPRGYLHPNEQEMGDWRSRESLGLSNDFYSDHNSRTEAGERFRNIGRNFLHKETPYETSWDDPYYTREAKKLKPDPELVDYSYNDYSKPLNFDNNNDYRSYGVRNDVWKVASNEKVTPEPEQSSLSLWKWEGTIAKGGTPVCRASCFPVGKAMNFMLPGFLDCTARTGLDMLSKHYYQASSIWVVFFVPDDADIEYYNEFMHYLEEKQRAAVAKLDDKTTLFLVPPSDFSEKVLKVPGNLSISGVVLRVDNAIADSDMTSKHRDSIAAYGVAKNSDEEFWSNNNSGALDLRKKQSLPSEADWVSYDQKRQIGSNEGGYQPPWPPSVSSGAIPSPPRNPSSSSANSEDAQKCLQATLQLAAALLQKIQQGKGN